MTLLARLIGLCIAGIFIFSAVASIVLREWRERELAQAERDALKAAANPLMGRPS